MVDLPYMKPIPSGRFSPHIFPPDLRGEGPRPAHHSWQAWTARPKKGSGVTFSLRILDKLKMYCITMVIWQLYFEYVWIWFNRKV